MPDPLLPIVVLASGRGGTFCALLDAVYRGQHLIKEMGGTPSVE